MPEERSLILHLHELLQYCNRSGATTFLTVAQHGLFGEMKAPIDLTYLADTVILLRYFEMLGEVRRAISVVKKRTSAHENTIREYTLHSRGISVGEPLTNPAWRAARRSVNCRRETAHYGQRRVIPHLSERGLILAPLGRDAEVAAAMLADANVRNVICQTLTRAGRGAQLGRGLCPGDGGGAAHRGFASAGGVDRQTARMVRFSVHPPDATGRRY